MIKLALVVAAAVLAATSCSGGGRHGQQSPTPPDPRLVAKAHLAPCPATGASTAGRKALPDLTLPCLVPGPAVHLAGLRGVPTLVNIWASWCTPCQAETRYLAAVATAAGGRVRFLGVDTEDTADSALDFAPHVSPPMRYAQVFDPGKKLLAALHLPSALPTTVLVDATGRVVRISPGAYRSAAAVRADLHRYLGVRL